MVRSSTLVTPTWYILSDCFKQSQLGAKTHAATICSRKLTGLGLEPSPSYWPQIHKHIHTPLQQYIHFATPLSVLCSNWVLKRALKPKSWKYNFAEVSGHNLESYEIWGFCVKRVWFSIRFSSFLLYSVQELNCRNWKRLRELSQGKVVVVTVNSKQENSEDFCLDLFQEFDLCREAC